ncbi:MAG: hypothetical protein HUJ71_08570 [Pseudobutyrivibrio sp.]|nr:hypothetical protein [Pseudobutyrivibrio sp.]
MKKRLVALLMVMTMSSACFIGCSVDADALKQGYGSKNESVADILEESEIEDKDVDEVGAVEPEEDEAEEKKSEKKEESDKKADDSDDKDKKQASAKAKEADYSNSQYVNFDDLGFFITVDGKTERFILGESTLQDMIDFGTPFDEDDILTADNVVKANSGSAGYAITLGEYYRAQVYVINNTDEAKKASECVLGEIYLPLGDGKEQDILSFDFPLDMTEEDLLNNAGEPTDLSEFDSDDDYEYHSSKYKYEKESDRYFGSYGYDFEYINGELRYVSIDFK